MGSLLSSLIFFVWTVIINLDHLDSVFATWIPEPYKLFGGNVMYLLVRPLFSWPISIWVILFLTTLGKCFLASCMYRLPIFGQFFGFRNPRPNDQILDQSLRPDPLLKKEMFAISKSNSWKKNFRVNGLIEVCFYGPVLAPFLVPHAYVWFAANGST